MMATIEQAEAFLKDNGWIKKKGHWLLIEEFNDCDMDEVFYEGEGIYDILQEGYAYMDEDGEHAVRDIQELLVLFDGDWETYCRLHNLNIEIEKVHDGSQ
jgi:hypothetical protein